MASEAYRCQFQEWHSHLESGNQLVLHGWGDKREILEEMGQYLLLKAKGKKRPLYERFLKVLTVDGNDPFLALGRCQDEIATTHKQRADVPYWEIQPKRQCRRDEGGGEVGQRRKSDEEVPVGLSFKMFKSQFIAQKDWRKKQADDFNTSRIGPQARTSGVSQRLVSGSCTKRKSLEEGVEIEGYKAPGEWGTTLLLLHDIDGPGFSDRTNQKVLQSWLSDTDLWVIASCTTTFPSVRKFETVFYHTPTYVVPKERLASQMSRADIRETEKGQTLADPGIILNHMAGTNREVVKFMAEEQLKQREGTRNMRNLGFTTQQVYELCVNKGKYVQISTIEEQMLREALQHDLVRKVEGTDGVTRFYLTCDALTVEYFNKIAADKAPE